GIPCTLCFSRVIFPKLGQILPRECARSRVRLFDNHISSCRPSKRGRDLVNSLPLGQLHRNMGRTADHARSAVGVGQALLVLDQGFQVQEKFFGKHGKNSFLKKSIQALAWKTKPTRDPGEAMLCASHFPSLSQDMENGFVSALFDFVETSFDEMT